MLVAVTAYSMIWATRAWSELNVGKPAKKRLQSAGRLLGVPSLLTYDATPLPEHRRSTGTQRVVKVRATS